MKGDWVRPERLKVDRNYRLHHHTDGDCEVRLLARSDWSFHVRIMQGKLRDDMLDRVFLEGESMWLARHMCHFYEL